jgi:hypothetical protein
MLWLELWLYALALVGVRSFQQKNVQGDHYFKIVPTSYVFAMCDIALMYRGLKTWEVSIPMTVLCVGTGAWMGCWISLYTHKRL